MRVAFNVRPLDGPWGGGNRFVQSLEAAFRGRGHEVAYGLESRIDAILIVDPRARNPMTSFTPGDAFRYVGRHPSTVVIHRINECDERKGTRFMNARLRVANYAADHTVFIGSWLKDLEVWRGESSSSVILNGADTEIFNAHASRAWNGLEPLDIVTHHWGGNVNKGFDVYRRLDAMLAEPQWRDRLRFTYIGNLPAGANLKNAQIRAPLDGKQLARLLSSHHVYLTASINEPAGMHHIEGALSGLPLLYRASGALPEYCGGFGECFEGPDDFAPAVERIMTTYQPHRAALGSYPHTAVKMTAAYLDLTEEMLRERVSIAKKRRRWRSPLTALVIQAPL